MQPSIHETARIHPTALIEEGVEIGAESSVWDNAHVRHGARIGAQCIIGGKTTVAYEVVIGDRCKINTAAYIPHGVTLEDGVMVSAGVIFTNDRFPRATQPDLASLRGSDPDEHTLTTLVKRGATIGAGALIGPGLSIGQFAMVGMGSVVTRNVPDFTLVMGSPARPTAFISRGGHILARIAEPMEKQLRCPDGYRYEFDGESMVEVGEA